MRRVALPPGGSTLTTSAPRPASVSPQYSACSSASSMTRIPVRGPRRGWVSMVARIYPVRRGGSMPTESTARVHLSIPEARALSERAMRGIGYDCEEAWILGDHVIDAALCGYGCSGVPAAAGDRVRLRGSVDPRGPRDRPPPLRLRVLGPAEAPQRRRASAV